LEYRFDGQYRGRHRIVAWRHCAHEPAGYAATPGGYPAKWQERLAQFSKNYNGDRGGQENLMKRIWKRTSSSTVLMLAITVFSTTGFALETTEAEARAACTWDVFRFCISAIPNLDRIIVCLEREKQNISKPCQAVLSANGH
jgi:hypothetical protein